MVAGKPHVEIKKLQDGSYLAHHCREDSCPREQWSPHRTFVGEKWTIIALSYWKFEAPLLNSNVT